MKRYPKCPNCGHEIIGTECRWCHYALTSHRPGTKNEAQRQAFQVVERLEQTAGKLTAKEKVRKDAEAESARLVTDAQQRATQIIREAKAKSESIINQGYRLAILTMKRSVTGNQVEQKAMQEHDKSSDRQK